MAEKRNNLSGIANATAITAGNSGGSSGDAFDSISGTPTVYTSADITAASDRGARADLASDTIEYFGWSITSATAGFARFYFRAGTIQKGYTYRMLRLFGSTEAIRGEVRLHATTTQLVFTDSVGGFVSYCDVAANTIYRVEIDWTSGSPEMLVYAGESTTPLSMTHPSPTSAFGEVSYVRFGAFTSAAATVNDVELACPAWSDTTWLGPEVSGAPGSVDYDVSIAVPQNTTARSGWVYTIDTTGSTGATTLVWDGTSRGTITESPTGVFSITDPDDGDAALALVLTAAGTGGQADDVVNLSIPRGGAATRPKTLTFVGPTWGDRASWK